MFQKIFVLLSRRDLRSVEKNAVISALHSVKEYALAMFDLGVLYYTGRGVTEDYTKAVEWFRKAADIGFDRDAMYTLGYMYANGDGVTQDQNEAIRWMRLAAENGSDRAKTWLERNNIR